MASLFLSLTHKHTHTHTSPTSVLLHTRQVVHKARHVLGEHALHLIVLTEDEEGGHLVVGVG
jgi:hypothetical protein